MNKNSIIYFFQVIKVKVTVENRPKEEKLSGEVIIVGRIEGEASFGKDILPSFIQKHIDMCNIEFSATNTNWPASGKVLLKGSQGEEASKCRTFNATYVHDGSYIPNVDYIPFVLTWRNEAGRWKVR